VLPLSGPAKTLVRMLGDTVQGGYVTSSLAILFPSAALRCGFQSSFAELQKLRTAVMGPKG